MAALKGSKTEGNLKDAFAGESQANRRYLYFAQKADVEQVLAEIGAAEVPQLVIFNKTDRLPDGKIPQEWIERFPRCAAISAKNPDDVASVRQLIIDFFDAELIETELIVRYDQSQLRAQIFASADVLSEEFGEQAATLRIRADKATLGRLAHNMQEVESLKE